MIICRLFFPFENDWNKGTFCSLGAMTCRLAVSHSAEPKQVQEEQVHHRKEGDCLSLTEFEGNTLIKNLALCLSELANSMHSFAQ